MARETQVPKIEEITVNGQLQVFAYLLCGDIE